MNNGKDNKVIIFLNERDYRRDQRFTTGDDWNRRTSGSIKLCFNVDPYYYWTRGVTRARARIRRRDVTERRRRDNRSTLDVWQN